jgi:tetratricopeptide (TPR) repeat protein
MKISKDQRFTTLHSLGYLLTMLKNYEESIKFTNEALSLNPRDNTLWYNKGTALQRWGKSKEAIKALDKGLSLNPEKSMKIKFLLNKGNAFSDLNKNQKAITCYKEMLSIDPDNKTAKDMINKLS